MAKFGMSDSFTRRSKPTTELISSIAGDRMSGWRTSSVIARSVAVAVVSVPANIKSWTAVTYKDQNQVDLDNMWISERPPHDSFFDYYFSISFIFLSVLIFFTKTLTLKWDSLPTAYQHDYMTCGSRFSMVHWRHLLVLTFFLYLLGNFGHRHRIRSSYISTCCFDNNLQLIYNVSHTIMLSFQSM